MRALINKHYNLIIMRGAFSGRRNVTVWRLSVCLYVISFFLTLIQRAAHIQHDSPGGSTRRGQRTYEDGHTYL